MARPTLIDLNPFELNYYPFIISIGKCNKTCNVVDDGNMCSDYNKRHKC